MASEAKRVYTMAEVSAHNSPKDCWIVIGGKVYDVTKFLANHPGGDEILLASVGKDSTNDFEEVGHGTAARAMLDEHCVGRIDAATIPRKFTYTPPKQTHYDQDKTYEFIISLLEFAAPLAILGMAVGVRVYNLSA